MVKAIMYEYKKMATKKGGKPKYLKNVGGLLMMRERQPNAGNVNVNVPMRVW